MTLKRISERRRERETAPSNVTPLRLIAKAEPRRELLESAENMLNAIRAGEIVAFAGGVLYADGANSMWRGGNQLRAPMAYVLERAKLKLMGFAETDEP